MNALQSELLGNLREAMVLLYKVEEEKNPEVSMSEFWKGKVVNAYGEEAMDFQGKSVVLGVLRISYATPPNTWNPSGNGNGYRLLGFFSDDGDWEEVAAGLLAPVICEAFPLNDVVKVKGEPVLGWFFGVPKNEEVDGVPVMRFIMDLRPVNQLFQSVIGDMNILADANTASS